MLLHRIRAVCSPQHASSPSRSVLKRVRLTRGTNALRQVVEIDASSEVAVEWSVSFRSMLPSVRILPAARDAVCLHTPSRFGCPISEPK